MSWTEKQAKALADKILSYSRAPECEVSLQQWRSSYTRFAANEVTTAGSSLDLRIQVQSRGNRRAGTATVNDTSPAGLEQAVRTSEELWAVASEDPELVEGLGRQRYPGIKAFHAETARAGAAERRAGVKAALDLARAGKLATSGFFENRASYSAVANKKGNFAFFPA